jgi:two-component system, cell cycle response regulator
MAKKTQLKCKRIAKCCQKLLPSGMLAQTSFSPIGMTTQTLMDIPVKPRVLIADDSRIVRATLIKHIEGMFEFREALDGEEAWETLLIDPNIRVVITDLTMPKLDGYGLLQRIRGSKISRIREIPVVVVSGSDEYEERERAKAAGATDLITKGMGTAQLLSRLDILAKLEATQHAFERSLEALVSEASDGATAQLPSAETFHAQAENLLATAVQNKRNFVLLNVCVGLKHVDLEGRAAVPPASVIDAIGQLLRRTIRQTDHVAKTGDAEFTLATGSINFDAAHSFAQRVCLAIAAANLVKDSQMSFVASCGMVALCDEEATGQLTIAAVRDIAHRRALLGLNNGITGVIGREEAAAFQCGAKVAALPPVSTSGDHVAARAVPDVITLVRWIKEGRQEDVLPYLTKLPTGVRALVDLALQRSKH